MKIQYVIFFFFLFIVSRTTSGQVTKCNDVRNSGCKNSLSFRSRDTSYLCKDYRIQGTFAGLFTGGEDACQTGWDVRVLCETYKTAHCSQFIQGCCTVIQTPRPTLRPTARPTQKPTFIELSGATRQPTSTEEKEAEIKQQESNSVALYVGIAVPLSLLVIGGITRLYYEYYKYNNY